MGSLTPELLAQYGPVGSILLLLVTIVMQYVRHGENVVKLDTILEQTQRINGRVGKLEEWRDGHDKQDDEREERHEREHVRLRSEVARERRL